MRRPLDLFTLFLFLVLHQSPTHLWAEDKPIPDGIPVARAADFIHAVIEASRAVYSQYIVERLGESIGLKSGEHWKEEKILPLPAQFLSQSAQISSRSGIGMSYRLMSLWPINPTNAPRNDFEKNGLEGVAKNPNRPHTGIVEANGLRYFQAVYPDLAVTKSCVRCHNSHAKSPKKDFKHGDVMGGILITLPLGQGDNKEQGMLSPEVVADYVHSVLEADRTVYAKFVVDRLQAANVIYASEHWWEENTLLLPAQFLLNASDLIKNSRSGLDFRLISQWPINEHNGPANEFERTGIESVAAHPLRPYIAKTKVGSNSYFQAIYPDLAVTPSCASCHNAHPKSPKHDFKLNDVMGGIVVTLPLNPAK
jgi:hypothetical protein